MSEKVYCEDCKKYSPYSMDKYDSCCVIEKRDTYRVKNAVIYERPQERNKYNNCKWFERRKKK